MPPYLLVISKVIKNHSLSTKVTNKKHSNISYPLLCCINLGCPDSHSSFFKITYKTASRWLQELQRIFNSYSDHMCFHSQLVQLFPP